MMRSLYSGVSGLKTHQTKMDVIGNNISNVNTVAFKSSSVTFTDIMYQTTSAATGATATTGGKNANQIGLGVSSGATKMSIASSGAAQSTGEAFDIKLTDSNNTNFFIVNNGSENLFTRSGSFYLDGNGNLAMTSTGYLVQGWQVDETGVAIRKDTVSALRVMQASNLTSSPEATTNAIMSGVLDKNDTNVNSDAGYVRSLTFYDKLGYTYTAKFAINATDTDTGAYAVKLTGIYDGNNNNILQEWMDEDPTNNTMASVFGKDTTVTKTFDLNSNFTSSGTVITTEIDDGDPLTTDTYQLVGTATQDASGTWGYTFHNSATNDDQFVSIWDMYSVDNATAGSGTLNIDTTTGKLSVDIPATSYDLKFKEDTGKFDYVDAAGYKAVTMNLKNTLGSNFEDIEINFEKCLNYDNGGSSTLDMTKGDITGTLGIGKKLGSLTGVSVDGTGKIFGSYDNGNTILLGQIAVAQFANASGLESLGNSCYKTTLNSGDFDGIGVEVTADGGSMATGQLEMSNVDLSAQFTEMIVTQRGFQANSRIITTSDSLLEELVNLKR